MDIWECALGFMDAQILMTAEEIGIFAALADGPASTRDLSDAVGLPPDGTERLLTALVALGLLERRDGNLWANGPDAEAKLVPGRPAYVGGMFRHMRHELYPLWSHLGAALSDGKTQWHRAFGDTSTPTERMYDDPERLFSFMDGMHAITHRAGAELAPRLPELAGATFVVDLGGAAGSFLIALAEENPRLRGAAFDLPPLRPIAESFIRRHGLEGRIGFLPGDFWKDPLPPSADAYCLGFILHDWDDVGGSILLEKIAGVARPDALLIVGEYLLDEDRSGPLFVARSDLNMLVAARGRERTATEYARWIGRFDFSLDRIERTSEGKSFLLFRRCG